MKSKIALAFQNCKKEKRPALITYTVAGDNTKNNSLKILNEISKHADILELGFPHNTPIADGGQIQGSSHRALKNGIKLKDVFQIVKKFKKNNPNKPIILMGYFNLIYQNGENNFLKSCKLSGVDGLIIVDLPYPENKNFAKKCKKKSISFIQLLSPTTSNERMRKIVTPENLKLQLSKEPRALFVERKFIYLFRRQSSIGVIWKQYISTSNDELMNQAIFLEKNKKILIDHCMIC